MAYWRTHARPQTRRRHLIMSTPSKAFKKRTEALIASDLLESVVPSDPRGGCRSRLIPPVALGFILETNVTRSVSG